MEKAEKEFSETMGILNEKRSQVRKLEEKLNALQSKFDEAQRKKEKLEADVKLCSFKLEKAQKLLGMCKTYQTDEIKMNEAFEACIIP